MSEDITSAFNRIEGMSKKEFTHTANKTGWETWAGNFNVDDKNFISFMNDPTQTEKTLAAFKQYPPVLEQTGISYDFAAIKAAALNSAMNVGIVMAATAAVEILAATWDHFNVTVEEQAEKLRQLNTQYETTLSEFDQLSAKNSLTESEKERLEYLEKQLELEEKLLEAETRRLYQEQQGRKFTDWFDPDNDTKKQAEEFGTGFSEKSTSSKLLSVFLTGASSKFYDIKASTSGYDGAVKKAEKDIEKLNKLKDKADLLLKNQTEQTQPGSFSYDNYTLLLNSNQEQQEKVLKRLYKEHATLVEKKIEYNENAYTAKERVDSGLLFGSDLEDAENSYNTWNEASLSLDSLILQLEELLGITTDIQDTATAETPAPLDGITKNTEAASQAMLDQIRITNAEEAVMASLGITFGNYAATKQEAADAGMDLFQAVENEIQALAAEGLLSQETADALFYYQLQKALANENGINTAEDCSNLLALAENAGITGDIIEDLIALKDIYQQISQNGLSPGEKEQLTAEAEKLTASIKTQAANFKTAENPAKQYAARTGALAGAQRSAASAADRYTSALEEQKSALESQKSVLEEQKQHYEDVIQAVNWFYDKQIGKVQTLIDGLQKENKLLEKRKGNYDMALSSIDRFYDREIQKSKERQDAVQEKIDALKAENEERRKSYELEKAAYELEKARNQRTDQVYVQGKGMVYVSNDNAVQEAENTYENLLEDQRVSDLEKQKADLDLTIAKLEEYRQLWSEVSSSYQFAQEDMMLSQLLGATWETDLLNGRMETLSLFRDTYNGIQAEINSNEQLIASYEEKIEYYQGLKDQWEELTGKYQEETYIQLLTTEFGNNYENELLNGRTGRWTKFSEEYASIQKQLKEVTDQIEALAARMESYASRMESAASRAKAAANEIKSVSIPSASGLPELSNFSMKTGRHIKGRARGGIVSPKDSNALDGLARSVGEDHLVPLQEGEAVIPKTVVRENAPIVQMLLAGKLNELKMPHSERGILDHPEFRKPPAVSSPLPSPSTEILNLTAPADRTTLQFYGDLSFPNIHSGDDAKRLIEELSHLSVRGRQYFNRQH